MKTLVKFASLIGFALGVTAFVLMLATNAVMVKDSILATGVDAIFGASKISGLIKVNPAPLALIGFILFLVAIVAMLIGFALPFAKNKKAQGLIPLFNAIGALCFLVAGIFMFLVLTSIDSANSGAVSALGSTIGAGWVIGGILGCAGALFCFMPVCYKLLSK